MLYDPGEWSRRKFIFTDKEWAEFNKRSEHGKNTILAQKKARGEFENKKKED